ncbi:MAG TPA: hypothetical protein VM734_00955 [Kofleriaceae bacterium]|nr:hypothetical protein [Kofleriaceae bacterium]
MRGRGAAAVIAVALAGGIACRGAASSTAPRAAAAPVCPAGPVTVFGQGDVDRLAGCAAVARLEVRTAAALDLAPLASLARIDGDLVIGPTLGLGTLQLPALTAVGGTVRIAGNGDLAGIYLPRLATVGALTITDDVALVQITAPALVEVAGDLTLDRTPTLELVDTSAGPQVAGDLTVSGAPRLATWVGAVQVSGLVEVDAPALAEPPTAAQP